MKVRVQAGDEVGARRLIGVSPIQVANLGNVRDICAKTRFALFAEA